MAPQTCGGIYLLLFRPIVKFTNRKGATSTRHDYSSFHFFRRRTRSMCNVDNFGLSARQNAVRNIPVHQAPDHNFRETREENFSTGAPRVNPPTLSKRVSVGPPQRPPVLSFVTVGLMGTSRARNMSAFSWPSLAYFWLQPRWWDMMMQTTTTGETNQYLLQMRQAYGREKGSGGCLSRHVVRFGVSCHSDGSVNEDKKGQN